MSLFRQLLITNSQKKKRKFFCEVEYLEGTGTQYINTGLLSTEQTTVDVVFGLSNITQASSTNGAIFGGRNSQTNRTFTLFYIASTNPQYFRFDYSGQVDVGKGTEITIDTTSKYEFKYENSKRTFKNITTNEEVSAGLTPSTTFTSTPIILFAVNTNGGGNPSSVMAGTYFKGRIYSYKYSDGETSIDLIPVLDWDMKPCMYDKVSGELFYNQGTGNFLYGREIHEVEYLESTGTQYIDTGFYFNDTTHTYGWEIEAQAVNTGYNSYKWFTGYNQNGVNSCGGYGDNATQYTFYPAGKYYQNGALVSTPSGGDKYAPVKNTISLTNKICDYSLVLFARMVSSSNTIDAGGTKRIFSAKYYDNSVLVRDYIPAVDENGVGFMFDRVTHTIFDNAGTGTFNYPPVELEYLESTGTQYILTGVKPTVNTDFEIELSSKQIGQNRWVMGAPTWVGIHYKAQNTNPVQIGVTNSSISPFQQYVPYNYDDSKITMKLEGDTVYANDVSLGTITRKAGTLDFALFGYRDANSNATLLFIGKIYKNWIKENGILIRDFIPCFKDGQIGMWDKVNGVLYTNAGTGSFITGKIVEK